MTRFSPAAQAWLDAAFPAPTPAQTGAWDAIARREHTLVVAPTGSGKTLAAFLSALDRLTTEPRPEQAQRRCRVLYVSPLKALAIDIERNLRAPLVGIEQAAARLGLPAPEVSVAMRTGDTPANERRAFIRRPADILITTPESLFLLLSSSARESLRGVDTVIVDEVHAVCATKRGAHLALSLDRLDALLDRPAQRIGLSATARPVDEVATFLAGGRPVTVVQPPLTKSVQLEVVVPVADMSEPDDGAAAGEPADRVDPRHGSIWPHVESRVLELVQAHRSTIVFANSRRLAERLTARLNELAQESAAAAGAAHAAGTTGAPLPTRAPAELMGESGSGSPAPDRPLARAHHGSVSREQRELVEHELKAGRLPAVVATSSLELGIDMGAVDLVVQVESPPSVASGLQRVGRAGHHVGAVSRGVIFPKFRGDLLECTVVAERMAAGLIESMRYPRNPLDVLAQHIVSIVSMDTVTVDELDELVHRSAPFAGLPHSALEAVLDMLAGRYPSDAFAELRPRLVWDRVTGELTPRRGAQRLAVTSGGTIPDRGLFGVFLAGAEGPARRVGELDEEMVYESRVGDVFLLGSSSWRIEEITHDRVLVSPAPGQPGRMPFWKGDSPGRPAELGRALGAFVRELAAAPPDRAAARARAAGLDEWGTANLLAYLDEQRAATRYLPDDRTVLVERFRDELGDWRLVVHSPFGAPVNAPWALAIKARLSEQYGVDVAAMHSDDGIVLRVPDTDAEPPGGQCAAFDPDEIESIVTAELTGSAVFAARFRECAARALLLPRRDPGRRTPLWQQRQRASQLLQVAGDFPQFPIVLEAMRECLQDVFDVPGLVALMRDLAARRIRLVEVETASASPFARSLLFGYVGMFLYEGDAPLAERRAQALSLDSALLAELLGTMELRELLDPAALAEVAAEVSRLAEQRHARGIDGVHDLLREVGDLSTGEALARGATAHELADLEEARRAIRVRIAGEQRWLAVEDAGRVRDALGTPLPVGVPEAFTEITRDPLGDLVSRYARTHGPFQPRDVATRLGLGVAVVDAALARLAAAGRVLQGEFRPDRLSPDLRGDPHSGGLGIEWCDAEVLRRIRRRSLAALRREVEPVPGVALARFVPAWQSVGGRSVPRGLPQARGVDGLLRAIEQLAGVPIPASALESLVLPSRVADYAPTMLDELTLAGEVVWTGAGVLSTRARGHAGDGRIALAPAAIAAQVLPVPETTLGGPAGTVRATLGPDQAMFFRALAERTGTEDDELTAAIWELVWAGMLTNDTLAPVRELLAPGTRSSHATRARTPRSRYGRYAGLAPTAPRGAPYTMGGRWSAAPARDLDPTRRGLAVTDVLLDRFGVLTRGSVGGEVTPGGFATVYRVLRTAEESGRVRRGYFVERLGAAQFALPGAVDRLRAEAAAPRAHDAAPGREPAPTLVLAATDPANVYGAALPWPRPSGQPEPGRGHQPARKAGALVVLVDGACVLYVERGGRSLLSFTEDPGVLQPAADALALAVRDGALGKLAVERADGAPVADSPLGAALAAAGFRRTPRGLRLRRS